MENLVTQVKLGRKKVTEWEENGYLTGKMASCGEKNKVILFYFTRLSGEWQNGILWEKIKLFPFTLQDFQEKFEHLAFLNEINFFQKNEYAHLVYYVFLEIFVTRSL